MMHELNKQQGRICISIKAHIIGSDLCVMISGGDSPHIGAVTLSVPRPSLADAQKISASTSVLTVTGHKDDDVARTVSHTLASSLNTHVVVTCGIHVDDITETEIITVSRLVNELVDELIHLIRQR